LPFPIDFDGRPYNTLTLPCERVIRHVTCNLVICNTDRAALEAGAAAEMAATRKEEKYVDLGARYIFEPIAVETLGVFNASARHLLDDLGTRISENTGEARISILVQRFNAVLLHDRLSATDCTDRLMIVSNFVFFSSISKLSRDFMYR